MDYEVLKPFKTVSRRFTPGEGPGGALNGDEDVSPLTIETLRDRKFIAPKVEIAISAPAPAPAPVSGKSKPSADDK